MYPYVNVHFSHIIDLVVSLLKTTGRTVALYIGTTLMAGIFGICSCLLFVRFYSQGSFSEEVPTYVTLGCGIESFLTQHADGTVNCTLANSTTEADTLWVFNDVNNTFVQTVGGAVEEMSLSDTIYTGVFESVSVRVVVCGQKE